MTAAILKWALFYSTTAKRRKTWYTKKASLHSSKYKKIQFWKTGYLPHLLTVSLLFQANKLLIEILDQYQYLGNCPPTPPLTQQQSINNKLGLMLG